MSTLKEILIPDIGDIEQAEVIEILVAPEDRVTAEEPLITLESDKATMEIPSPHTGVIRELKVTVGDKVTQGDLILILEVADELGAPATETSTSSLSAPEQAETVPVTPDTALPSRQIEAAAESTPLPGEKALSPPPVPPKSTDENTSKPHASPAVRRISRELGVDLTQVTGSGPKGRILKGDVQLFVKGAMAKAEEIPSHDLVLPKMPAVDYTKFGEIKIRPLPRIKTLSGTNLHRNWLTIPHVTQFDEADITDLEAFCKAQTKDSSQQSFKLTLLAFLMKATVVALKKYPHFNASLDPGGKNLVIKKYFHIGFAVDTNAGLVVPVVRNADCKGLFDLARELSELGTKAREKRLTPADMQGGSFTISSLGGIGGTAFTPIVNAPEVAILGVSRAAMKPVYSDGEFVPRLILPFSLSYDHRVIDGADGVRFTRYLSNMLSDIRNLSL